MPEDGDIRVGLLVKFGKKGAQAGRVEPRIPSDAFGRVLTFYRDELAQLEPLAADAPTAERQRRRVLLRNHVLLYTLYFTAGRVSEVLSLRCAQVDDRETAQIRGKGGKNRALFLCQDLRSELDRLLAQRRQDPGYRASAPLFVSYSNRNAGERLTPHSAWDIVRAAAEAVFAGLARVDRPEAHPHLLRHLRAQHLYSAEMPLAELQAILGHASVDTTRRFYAPLDEQIKIQRDLEAHGLSPAEVAARAAAAKVTRGG
jgi:site-specific recombinase XerD